MMQFSVIEWEGSVEVFENICSLLKVKKMQINLTGGVLLMETGECQYPPKSMKDERNAREWGCRYASWIATIWKIARSFLVLSKSRKQNKFMPSLSSVKPTPANISSHAN